MKGKVLVVKNFFIVLAGLSVVVCAIYAGSKMYKKNNHSSEQAKMDSLAEIIEDDCTEQWNELNSSGIREEPRRLKSECFICRS